MGGVDDSDINQGLIGAEIVAAEMTVRSSAMDQRSDRREIVETVIAAMGEGDRGEGRQLSLFLFIYLFIYRSLTCLLCFRRDRAP